MKIFYGPKGSGKTKAILDDANSKLDTAKGHIVFISDTNKNSFDLKYQARFIDASEFGINGEDALSGFIKGIVAANSDNERIYIDGISRITLKSVCELKNIFNAMEELEKKHNVEFILTCSGSKEEMPEFVLKYID